MLMHVHTAHGFILHTREHVDEARLFSVISLWESSVTVQIKNRILISELLVGNEATHRNRDKSLPMETQTGMCLHKVPDALAPSDPAVLSLFV